ncbi:molybdopterin cofactor-binding domain-containing protein [Falsiroseomonas sp. CW058]|uniref:xanthine dehydrogenase family protein molybdopterin-binding subunit n=1 Tax=Falsiroseomonas sp. CW058 TaxID=3388664 RepID=UPI003D311941
MTIALERRSLLRAAGALVIGFSVPLPARDAAAQARPPVQPPATGGQGTLTAYLSIAPDGAITLWSPTTEMGQGTWTAHAAIVADELGADPARITVENPHPDAPYRRDVGAGPAMGSGGSWGVRYWFEPLRQATARARVALIQAGAARLGVPAAELVAEDHHVLHRASGRKLGFGDLAAAAAAAPLPETAPLRPAGELKLIGRGMPRIDIPAKTHGGAIYSIDFRLPGMVYAYAKLNPVFRGEAEGFDKASAMAVPGVIDVVAIPGGAAVVASSMWAAMRGGAALKVTWKATPHDGLTSEAISATMRDGLAQPQGAVARNDGDVEAALRGAAKVVEAEYEVPFLSHTPLEPYNINVRIDGDRLEIWGPSQNQDRLVNRVVRDTGWDRDKVRFHTMMQGGGFGRRLYEDIPGSAVIVARAVGRPVKLFWSREDEIGQGWYRPAQAARFRAALDAQGKVTGLWVRTAGTSMNRDFNNFQGDLDASSVQTLNDTRYRTGAYRVDYVRRQVPVPTMPWRSVGATQNGFFMECFLDELAQAAGKDPVALRRELLAHDPRALNVVNTAAEKAGWGTPLPAGRARGFAFVESYGSLCAQVAEVSIENGRPRVHRVVVALDCGRQVLPDGVRSQIEGGVIQGLSTAMGEKIVIEGGRVRNANFDGYEVLRTDEAPTRIEAHVIESGERMGGVGEPPVPPITPAVANAVSALIGRRVRRLPLVDGMRA